MTRPGIEGECAAEFAPLREAFARNFAEHGEVGAAVAVVRNGRLVVDLWGGDDGNGEPWRQDTLVNVWSTTKGVTAACFAMIADRKLVDYDHPVAYYWPEFAAAGKERVTVAMLLSHQAGLCGFREPASLEDFYDPQRAAATLAAAAPFWEPGSQSGYHAISVGFLAGELFRRIEGRSLRRFVAEELAGFDVTIGLPAERERRVATMLSPPELSSAPSLADPSPAQVAALANPPLDPTVPNTAAWRAAEIPSANGFATARGLALLYGALVAEAEPLVSADTLAAATRVRKHGLDAVLGLEARWAAGFLVNVLGLYGASPDAFGHSGWGGSFAFADPQRRLGFAYVPNRMGTELAGDPRALALIEALERSLG